MKKIINVYFCAVMLLSLAACSDSFLDLYDESKENEKTFFKTEDDFVQATNGVYEALRATTGKAGFLMGEQRSDNAHYMRNEVDRGQRIAEEIGDFTDDAINGHTNTYYNDCFSGIAKANTTLDRIQGKDFSTTFTNSIVGQVKFLRAYFYFQLVRYYGGVPLHLTEVKNENEAFLPRASVDQVYDQIISDLNDAISKLEVVKFPQNGRATQGTARMMLAEVLMSKTTRDYAGAETQLREIMKMGYQLLPNYADVFDINHKNSTESIFEVQYKEGDQGQESRWLYWMMPVTNSGAVITGVAGSNNVSDGGWNMPTQLMVDSYEKGDLRINPSIVVVVGSYDLSGFFLPEKVLNVGDPTIKNYPSFTFMVNKYRHQHEKINNTDDNWPIYRYSDALLSLAECLFLQSKNSNEAIGLINQVRSRAGLPDVTTVNADIIANERRHELAFENHRWHDLVRTGKAIEVMNAYGVKIKQLYPYLESRTYHVTQDKLIFPIPFRELQINKQLTQNPGY